MFALYTERGKISVCSRDGRKGMGHLERNQHGNHLPGLREKIKTLLEMAPEAGDQIDATDSEGH